MKKRLVAMITIGLAIAVLPPGWEIQSANAQPTDAGGKPSSPTTDLNNYPKLPPPVESDPGPADRAPGEPTVVSVDKQADGGVAVTTYTPASGWTPARLADQLRRGGVPDVRVVTPDQPLRFGHAPCPYQVGKRP